jgi:hypothetical protein
MSSSIIQAETQTGKKIYRTNMRFPEKIGGGVHLFFLKEDNVLATTPRIISRQGQKSVELFFYHNKPFWNNDYNPLNNGIHFKSAFSLWNAIDLFFTYSNISENRYDAFIKCIPRNFDLMFIPECKWSELQNQFESDETIKTRISDVLQRDEINAIMEKEHFFDFVVDSEHLNDMIGLQMKTDLEVEKAARSKNIQTVLKNCNFKNIGPLVREIVGTDDVCEKTLKIVLSIIKKTCYPCVHWFVPQFENFQIDSNLKQHFNEKSLVLAFKKVSLSSQPEFDAKKGSVVHNTKHPKMSIVHISKFEEMPEEKSVKAKHGITLFSSTTGDPFLLLCFSNMWIFGRLFKSIYVEKNASEKTKFEKMVWDTDPCFALNIGFRKINWEHTVFSPFWMSVKDSNFYIGGFFNCYSYPKNMNELFEQFDEGKRGTYSGVKIFKNVDESTVIELTSPEAVKRFAGMSIIAKQRINEILIPPSSGTRVIQSHGGVFTLLIRTTAGFTDRMIMQTELIHLDDKVTSENDDSSIMSLDEFGEPVFFKQTTPDGAFSGEVDSQ